MSTNKRSPDHEQLEEVLSNDFAGLSDADARIALRAAQRDQARRAAADPKAALRKELANLSPNEFERRKDDLMG